MQLRYCFGILKLNLRLFMHLLKQLLESQALLRKQSIKNLQKYKVKLKKWNFNKKKKLTALKI